MTQAEFMAKLKKQLKRKVMLTEQRQILSDYCEYFDVGLSDGKTEQQLAAEFGDPKIIVNELIVEHRISSTTSIAEERVKQISERLGKGKKYLKTWLLPVNVLLFVIAGVLIYFMFKPEMLLLLFASQNPYAMGPFLDNISLLLTILSVVCFAAWLYCCPVGIKLFPVLAGNLAVIFEMSGINYLLGVLSDLNTYNTNILNVTLTSALKTVIALFLIYLFTLLIRYLSRRRVLN